MIKYTTQKDHEKSLEAMDLPSWCHISASGGATNIWNGLAEGEPPVGGGLSRPKFVGHLGVMFNSYYKWQRHGQNMKVTRPGNDCYLFRTGKWP